MIPVQLWALEIFNLISSNILNPLILILLAPLLFVCSSSALLVASELRVVVIRWIILKVRYLLLHLLLMCVLGVPTALLVYQPHSLSCSCLRILITWAVWTYLSIECLCIDWLHWLNVLFDLQVLMRSQFELALATKRLRLRVRMTPAWRRLSILQRVRCSTRKSLIMCSWPRRSLSFIVCTAPLACRV